MKSRLLADIGLAMLIALPAVAPAEVTPRTVEALDALTSGSAEPRTLAVSLRPAEPLANRSVGL